MHLGSTLHMWTPFTDTPLFPSSMQCPLRWAFLLNSTDLSDTSQHPLSRRAFSHLCLVPSSHVFHFLDYCLKLCFLIFSSIFTFVGLSPEWKLPISIREAQWLWEFHWSLEKSGSMTPWRPGQMASTLGENWGLQRKGMADQACVGHYISLISCGFARLPSHTQNMGW